MNHDDARRSTAAAAVAAAGGGDRNGTRGARLHVPLAGCQRRFAPFVLLANSASSGGGGGGRRASRGAGGGGEAGDWQAGAGRQPGGCVGPASGGYGAASGVPRGEFFRSVCSPLRPSGERAFLYRAASEAAGPSETALDDWRCHVS